MRFFLYTITILLLFSCRNNDSKIFRKTRHGFEVKHIRQGKIVEVFNANEDTIKNGAFVSYDINGHIREWYWFLSYDSTAIFSIQYEKLLDKVKNQNLSTSLRGSPFLLYKLINDKYYIEMVNPPNVHYIIGSMEYDKNRLVSKRAFIPYKTDTTSWVSISKNQFNSRYKYKFCYYIVDSNNYIIDSTWQFLNLSQ